MKRFTRGAVLLCSLGVAACVQPDDSASPPVVHEAPRLADVVVTDPSFSFATTRPVRVEFRATGTAPQAVELFDADGRRLLDGAFKPGATIDVRLPVGRADTLKLRVGKGASAIERELAVGANNHAIADL